MINSNNFSGLNITDAAFDLGQKASSLSPVTCSETGYKKGNNVNIMTALD